MPKLILNKKKTTNQQLKNVLQKINSRILPEKERKEILDKISKTIHDLCRGNNNVYSVFTAGSLTRGDFIFGVSDFDLIIVFEEERYESNFLKILEKECEKKFQSYFQNNVHQNWAYDIRSEFLFKIPTKVNPTPQHKTEVGFFGFRTFDTVENGKTLYGNNFLKDLIAVNPKVLAQERVKSLLKKYHQKNDDIWKIMHIGDIIKDSQIHFGEITYEKRKVLKGFIKFVPDFNAKDFIFEFWQEYLDNNFFKTHNKKLFMKKSEKFLFQLIKIMDVK